MEADQLYKSLEALRNELLAVSNGNHSTIDAKMDSVQSSVDEIKEHMKTLNGRTRKAEDSIARIETVVWKFQVPISIGLVVSLGGILFKLLFGVS